MLELKFVTLQNAFIPASPFTDMHSRIGVKALNLINGWPSMLLGNSRHCGNSSHG